MANSVALGPEVRQNIMSKGPGREEVSAAAGVRKPRERWMGWGRRAREDAAF